MDEQAKDRVHRIGQLNEVRVFRFVTANTVEEGILSKAMSKKDLDNKIIQAGMFNDKGSDAERNLRLRDLISKDMGKEEEDDSDDADEIMGDEELNSILSRGTCIPCMRKGKGTKCDDHEFELF